MADPNQTLCVGRGTQEIVRVKILAAERISEISYEILKIVIEICIAKALAALIESAQ